ncbi:MAG: glycosyltransferase, partial [Niameybacter sp.]
MKKILITCWAMEIGGVERSLLGLLNAIDYSKYEVDLFLCRHEGEFMQAIPEAVHLLPEIKAYKMFQKPIKEIFQSGCVGIGLIRTYCKLKMQLKERRGTKCMDSLLAAYCKASLPILPNVSDKAYDLALSFLTPHYFAIHKAKAKQHIAWIHTDYTALNLDHKLESRMWGAYDYIAGVSTQCAQAFKQVFPEHSDKVIEIENILSQKVVKAESEVDVSSEMPEEAGITKLCTVGRFSTAKAFDNAVRLCKLLIDKGCKVKWYAVGYGGDEPIIRQLIEELEVQDSFIIIGKKTNPYPYMKACDIYIQPSRYEGKAVAVREAQMLGKPVIITNFETAPSQLEEGVDGIIVPMELTACADAIQKVIEDSALQERLKETLATRDYGNEEEVEKLEQLVPKKVRVLHCIGKMNCGGAETMLMNLYRHIDRDQVQFDFLVHSEGEGYYDEEIYKLGGHIYQIPSQGTLGIVGYVKQLKIFLKETGPFDVVHSHLDWQGGLIALAARLANVKNIVVHAHTSKLMNKHLVYQVLLRIQKVCIAICATDYWGCSKEANTFLFYRYLCKKQKVKVIPNAIDLTLYKSINRVQTREELGIASETLLIGHVGSFSSFKNQLFLIEVAKKLRELRVNFKFLLVGEGQENYKKQVREQIEQEGLEDYVQLLGLRQDVPNIMSTLDLFLLPSLFEGLGIV